MSDPTESYARAALVAARLGRPLDNRMARYVELLATAGVERGLIGPREVDRLWDRHVLNCLVLEQLVPSGARVADIGSGAGLPGIVLALVRPDLSITLVEPLLRRATFLGEALEELGLAATVSVARVRAEEHRGTRYDVVTARAVAPLDRLATIAAPLLARQGVLLAMKGQRAAAELDEHRAALARLGLVRAEIRRLGDEILDEPTTVVVMSRSTQA